MATKIGDFFAELQLRNKKFLEKLKTSQIGLDRTAKVGKVALGALAVAAAAATTAMVMLAKKSITMAVDFDESMRKVNTLAQLGQEGFEGMKEEVLDLSKTLGKSATEMSDALYQVISATFEGAEAMEVLKTGVMMATAGMAGQVETVDALTTVLNAWGLSAKDAERVADTFFLTIKYGKTTMAELAPAIGVVATMAANAGLSFEEVGAALSALTIVGVDTNRAVTGLSAILTALTKPTDEAKEAAAELGIDFSLTGLKAQGLSKWLGELKDATKGESEQLARFFQNVRAVRAVLPLATNAAEAFNSNLIKMQTETGAAREAFEEMDLAYSRIIERLKVQFEAIYIAVGEDLVPELLKFSKILSDPDFLESIKTVALGIVNFATGVMKLVRGISELVNAYILLKDQEKGVMEPTLLRFVKSQIETYKRLIEEEKEHGGIVGANSIRIMEYTELLGWFELKLEQLTSDQRAINDALIEQERIIKELEEGTEELTDTTEEFGDAIKYGVNRMGEFHRKANQVKDDIEDVTKSTDIWGDVGRQVIGDLTSEIISLTRAVDENVSGWDRFWNIVESGMETLMSTGISIMLGMEKGGIVPAKGLQFGGVIPSMSYGIATKPTFVAGEKGAEAVIPLDKLSEIIRNSITIEARIVSADPKTTVDFFINEINEDQSKILYRDHIKEKIHEDQNR